MSFVAFVTLKDSIPARVGDYSSCWSSARSFEREGCLTEVHNFKDLKSSIQVEIATLENDNFAHTKGNMERVKTLRKTLSELSKLEKVSVH
ncbi:hypothetical protein [Kiloniella sp.]|uniref:hypothetical protein n=1 Tax=Kiloniella sp. TaxID=1938587 RepID=UPI003B0153B9